MKQTTVVIPTTIKKATDALNGIDSLLTAKGWERAAIVYAFTTNEMGRGDKVANTGDFKLPVKRFAALGINGLKSHTTVESYRQAWIDGKGDLTIKPGDTVKLPTGKFPPTDPRVGDDTRGYITDTTPPEKVAEVVGKLTPAQSKAAAAKLVEVEPEIVADVVSDDRATFSSAADMYEEKAARPPRKPRELDALDTVGILTELPIAIDKADTAVDAVVEKAEIFSRLLRKGSVPSAPEVVAEVLADIATVQHKLGVAVALVEDGLSSVGKSVEELL